MRRITRVALTLSASAALLLGCDGNRPLEPSERADGGASAARAAASELVAPSNLTAVAYSSSQIDVRWQDNSNETAFELQRSTTGETGFATWATIGTNGVVYNDVRVESLKEYCYKLRAVRQTGTKTTWSAFSDIACVLTTGRPSVPEAPSNIAAVAVSESQIDIVWQDNSADETSFQISGSGFLQATVPANAVAYSHQGLQPVTQYCYQVRAVHAIQWSDGSSSFSYSEPSATACATTPPPPPPPAPPDAGYVVGATPFDSYTVELSVTWTLTTPPPNFRIERSTTGGATWELVGQGGGDNTFWDGPVASEQLVCYRIVGYNAAGDATPSNSACVTPLGAPTNLIATAVDAETLELTWNDNSTIEEGYQVVMICGQGSYDNAGWSEYECGVVELPPNATSWRTVRFAPPPLSSLHYYVVAKKDGSRSSGTNSVGSW